MSDKRSKSSASDGMLPSVCVLSGGAPNSPLMAGALAAIWDNGKTFQTFYTSGAGGIIGMLYLAARDKTPSEALATVLDSAIDDRIYNWFPMPYKTFFKSGPFAASFIEWAQSLHVRSQDSNPRSAPARSGRYRRSPYWPFFPIWPPSSGNESWDRFYNDWIDLWAGALCPTDLNFFSEGLCCPTPLVADVIDFEKLNSMPNRLFLNAFNIDRGKIQDFNSSEIGVEHFHAALSFPFVYSPTKIGTDYFFEGSTRNPLNLDKLPTILRKMNLDVAKTTVVLIDVLGPLERALVRKPRNIFDAFSISILDPIVSLAIQNKDLFKSYHPDTTFLELTFDIEESRYPYIADWSTSNMTYLWDVGYKAGAKFVLEHGGRLPDRLQPGH